MEIGQRHSVLCHGQWRNAMQSKAKRNCNLLYIGRVDLFVHPQQIFFLSLSKRRRRGGSANSQRSLHLNHYGNKWRVELLLRATIQCLHDVTTQIESMKNNNNKKRGERWRIEERKDWDLVKSKSPSLLEILVVAVVAQLKEMTRRGERAPIWIHTQHKGRGWRDHRRLWIEQCQAGSGFSFFLPFFKHFIPKGTRTKPIEWRAEQHTHTTKYSTVE